jgi:hypothetical protein
MKPGGKFAVKTLAASPLGLPPLRFRAALNAAPSTAFESWDFTR